MNTSFPNAVSLSKQQESSLPSTTGATSVTSDLSATREEEHDRTLKSNRTSYYYLTPNAVSRLPDYRYQGEDLSLLYKYVLSPLASWCVDNLTPRWVAPNAITTCGLCWMIAAYSIVWYHCPDLYEANTDVFSEGTVPRWIFLFNCSAMLIYQTLDNMDGKQARRTGTGSALGLLFDHGCDAVNSIFGSGNWIVAMALVPGNVADLDVDYTNNNIQEASLLSQWFGGDGVLACLLVLCPMMAFYISTWEQYYTGKLTLPPFNGPSEGLVLGASLSFISFLWGPMYWQTTSLTDGILGMDIFASLIGGEGNSFSFLVGRVRNMDLIVLASVFGLVQEVSLKMLSVSRKYGLQVLWTTLPNVVMIVSTLVMVCSDSTLMLRRSRTVMHLIAGLFTEQTTQLMLDHVVEEPYEVLKRYSLFPQIILALVMVLNHRSGNEAALFLSSEILDRILFVYTAGLWVYLVFKIRIQIFEICDVLGIYCFDITSVHPNKMGAGVEEGDKKTN